MHPPFTITHLNLTVTRWIEQEAERTGLTAEEVVRQLIYRGLEMVRPTSSRQRFHDLDALIGTWSEEDAAEFNLALADHSQLEPALWP